MRRGGKESELSEGVRRGWRMLTALSDMLKERAYREGEGAKRLW